ncbi:DUF4145 domain-containing protein [Leptospira terpstrae]|nr:DUF4145 domain-containing protein [Leptospira terpstrae]
MKYVIPKASQKSFTCYHCGVLSKQSWDQYGWDGYRNNMHPEKNIIKASTCDHCGNHALWIQGQNYYPGTGNSLPANPDMPEPVLKLYNEASSISLKSPRGSAALLRLAIQILCKELGEEGKNINTDIGNLVKKGLPELVQQSLDIVRVIGNDAVHPGQIDTDEIDTVSNLFELVNVIVEYMISLPKRIGGIYSNLPNEKIKGIEDRDKK